MRRTRPRMRGALVIGLAVTLGPATTAPASPSKGDTDRLGPRAGPRLVEDFERFLRDRDVDAFRRRVSARDGEATLARLLRARDLRARRASVLALGLFGGIESNAAVALALRDPDPIVRGLADNALWAIWFRADTPENNEALAKIRGLIEQGRFAEAIESADRLIARSPGFAEAHNQRAIAHFLQGQFAESVADCRLVLDRNPYHTGALSGMGQCLLRLGRNREALDAFRKAGAIQPYNEGLRETIAALEAGID